MLHPNRSAPTTATSAEARVMLRDAKIRGGSTGSVARCWDQMTAVSVASAVTARPRIGSEAALSAGGPEPTFALCRTELISGRSLADAAAPDGADGQRVGDGGGGIAVDQQQVGAGPRGAAATIGEAESARRGGGGRPQGLHRGQARGDQQLELVVHAGAVGHAAE